MSEPRTSVSTVLETAVTALGGATRDGQVQMAEEVGRALADDLRAGRLPAGYSLQMP